MWYTLFGQTTKDNIIYAFFSVGNRKTIGNTQKREDEEKRRSTGKRESYIYILPANQLYEVRNHDY